MLSMCPRNPVFNSIFQYINDKKVLHSYVFYVIRMLQCTLLFVMMITLLHQDVSVVDVSINAPDVKINVK